MRSWLGRAIACVILLSFAHCGGGHDVVNDDMLDLSAIDPNDATTRAYDASLWQADISHDLGPQVSISKWTKCDGVTDDWAGATQAFAAASHYAATLIVDCPVYIHFGSDIARTIFIDNGTTVVFSGAGKLIIDDVFLPAFAIADTADITLTDWNLEWTGSMPVDQYTGSYYDNGKQIMNTGYAPSAGAFNTYTLTDWLSTNRGIVFDKSQGAITARWQGPINTSTIFFIVGDSTNIKVTGMKAYAPQTAGVQSFIPMLFSFGAEAQPSQTITATTPETSQYSAVPHGLEFSNITIDGYYNGWAGTLRDAVFSNITAMRYGDLQDANRQNVGGVDKWYSLPHLFTIGASSSFDAGLVVNNIQLSNIVDQGVRLGNVRDKGAADRSSTIGAASLDLSCTQCSVNGYTSRRPDGFLALHPSTQLVITNVMASYDSAFLNNLFSGITFLNPGNNDVTLSNISFGDTATTSLQPPVASTAPSTGDVNVTCTNVNVTLNAWGGTGSFNASFGGTGNDIALTYSIASTGEFLASSQKDTLAVSLSATPATVSAGATTSLAWTASNTTSCTASGDWSGSLAMSGTQTPTISAARTFTLTCQAAGDSTSVTVPVTTK